MRLFKSTGKTSNPSKTLFLLFTGAVSGFINGFLGTGGGILLLFSAKIEEKALPPAPKEKDRFAQTVYLTLIFSIISAVIYLSSCRFEFSTSLIYLPPAFVGGLIGAKLLDLISVKLLNIIFSLLLIVAGGIMLLR